MHSAKLSIKDKLILVNGIFRLAIIPSNLSDNNKLDRQVFSINFVNTERRKIKIDNKLYEIDNVPELNKKVKHDLSVLVDRIVINSSLGNRLAESVETSINLALVKTTINSVEIELSARSMDNKKLTQIKEETVERLESLGFKVHTSGKYPAWKPDVNEFTSKVLEVYKKYDKNASLEAIHAGLECAIFKDKFSTLKIASIGPNIFSPHSNAENVEIKSIDKLYEITKEIVETI